jgi:chromosome segregation ATPase
MAHSGCKDLRKLKYMITDLTAMKKELLNEGDSGEKTGNMNTFEGQYHAVNQLVAQIKSDADRLQEFKKTKGVKYRDQTTISLRSQISANTKKASELIMGLSKMAEKEEKKIQKILKKGKPLKKEDEKKQEEHQYHAQVITVLRESLKLVDDLVAPESAELKNLRQSLKSRTHESAIVEHKESEPYRSSSRPKSARRRQRLEMTEIAEESDENVQAWMSAVENNQKEQDEMLAKISDGLDDLKRMAEDMNSELTKQEHMLGHLDQKIDDNIEKFRTSNRQLKDLLKKSGGCSRWGVVLILCLVLLGLVGAIFIL